MGTVYRMKKIETNEYTVGDKIAVGKYTATCQNVTDEGILFLMDTYDDEPRPRTGLIEYLNSDEGLEFFPEDIRDALHPGSVRVPYAGELFEKDEIYFLEDDGKEQWTLMQDRRNVLAMRENEPEWGWLMNKRKNSAADFGSVYYNGGAGYCSASNALGVRRAFLIE